MAVVGRIMTIPEILEAGKSLEWESVRTWGEVIKHNRCHCIAYIRYERKDLRINTTFVQPSANLESNWMFIGRILFDDDSDEIYLKATMAVNINNLNQHLLNQAIDITRRYLKSRKNSSGNENCPQQEKQKDSLVSR